MGEHSAVMKENGLYVTWENLVVHGRSIDARPYIYFPENYYNQVFRFGGSASGATDGYPSAVIENSIFMSWLYDNGLPEGGGLGIISEYYDPHVASFSWTGTEDAHQFTHNGQMAMVHQVRRTSPSGVFDPWYEMTLNTVWYIARGALYRATIDHVYIYNICAN